MRYLLLVASAAWLVARAVAHALRRRAHRVRRYAEDLPAAAPGAVVLQLPTARTGSPAPALPEGPPRIGGRHRRPEPIDLFAARAPHTRAQTAGLVRLVALSHQQTAARTAVAA